MRLIWSYLAGWPNLTTEYVGLHGVCSGPGLPVGLAVAVIWVEVVWGLNACVCLFVFFGVAYSELTDLSSLVGFSKIKK